MGQNFQRFVRFGTNLTHFRDRPTILDSHIPTQTFLLPLDARTELYLKHLLHIFVQSIDSPFILNQLRSPWLTGLLSTMSHCFSNLMYLNTCVQCLASYLIIVFTKSVMFKYWIKTSKLNNDIITSKVTKKDSLLFIIYVQQ